MRGVAERAMRSLVQLVRVFFRSVEVDGGDRLPREGPVVLVANHVNGLVDGVLLIAVLRRYPRFLGKSTLFAIPPLWPFLKLAGVVKVYRPSDGAPSERNATTFRTSRRLLADGGMVALFPEGISHNEPAVQPLRTGAARIALGAAFDDGVPGVVTVPVGLVYDAKARFRSRALVRVGTPTPVDRWAARYRADPQAAVHGLTDALTDELRVVAPEYRSWSQAAALAAIAEIAASSESPAPTEVDLAERERIARALAAREGAAGDEVAALRAELDGYERELAVLGLTDRQLCVSAHSGRVGLMVAWSMAKTAAALPVAAAGVLIHVVPYELIKVAATKPTNDSMRATVKLLGNFALFTIEYGVLAVVASRRYGVATGAGVFAGAPLCGYVTVRVAERVARTGGVVDGYRVVRGRRHLVATVLERRRALGAHARAVLDTPRVAAAGS
jgi:glycerol-3-phosphate O-acyltransferase/dihydroxyacetone phosphate acyltransferase